MKKNILRILFITITGASAGLTAQAGCHEYVCDQAKINQCNAMMAPVCEDIALQVRAYRSLLVNPEVQKTRCWNDQRAATERKRKSELSLATIKGALEPLLKAFDEDREFYQKQKNQYEVIVTFRSHLQNYFKEVIIALKNDVSRDSQEQLNQLQSTLTAELAMEQDQGKVQMVNVVLSMVGDIQAALQTGSTNQQALLDRLNGAIARDDSNGDASKKLSLMTKAAMEGAISSQNMETMDLSQMMSVLMVQAQALAAESKERFDRDSQAYWSMSTQKSVVQKIFDGESQTADTLQMNCAALQYNLDTAWPKSLWERELDLAAKTALHNSCGPKNCHFDNSDCGGGHSG